MRKAAAATAVRRRRVVLSVLALAGVSALVACGSDDSAAPGDGVAPDLGLSTSATSTPDEPAGREDLTPGAEDTAGGLTVRPIDGVESAESAGKDCSEPGRLLVAAPIDATHHVTACDPDGEELLRLGPAVISGDSVAYAEAVDVDDDGSENTDDGRVQPSEEDGGPGDGEYAVRIQWTPAVAVEWHDFTAAHVSERAALLVGPRLVSAPTIQEPAPKDGVLTLHGDFTRSEAEELADQISPQS